VAALALAGVTIAVPACGDDPNDAPGGSAPPTTSVGPGSEGSAVPATSGPAAESADEGHPSVPVATPEGSDGG
jgi:hypothetical protein